MTGVVEEIRATVPIHESIQDSLAPWHIRSCAAAVDVLPGVAVLTTLVLAVYTVPVRSTWWWLCMSFIGIVILLVLVNRSLLPTITGWSLGRALCGIVVVRRGGAGAGVWRLLLRDLAHLLDVASTVGWLWPLWDSRRRTFADMLLHTEVRRVEPATRPCNVQRWTAVAAFAAAGLCLGSAVISYVVVYSRDRAIDQVRGQIETQGPKIVAQMLTYDPKTLSEDFPRAQSLATDNYRGQLAVQQDAVRKGHPVLNEYWVTNSSIQSATPSCATMLLFMQGRRGEGAAERYLTATVRAAFVRSGGSQWRVDNLVVLTKPKPSGSEK